jgi:hypothetical protein
MDKVPAVPNCDTHGSVTHAPAHSRGARGSLELFVGASAWAAVVPNRSLLSGDPSCMIASMWGYGHAGP